MVQASLNTEDPQYQDKRLVAQRNGKLTVQVFHVYVGKEKDQLSNYFKDWLASYPTTLDEDDILLADSNLDAKRRVATQLVRLEKNILNSCLQATIELMDRLPDLTVSPCPVPYAPLLK